MHNKVVGFYIYLCFHSERQNVHAYPLLNSFTSPVIASIINNAVVGNSIAPVFSLNSMLTFQISPSCLAELIENSSIFSAIFKCSLLLYFISAKLNFSDAILLPHLIHCYAYASTFMLWSMRNKSICCASSFLPITV